jgi:hypothetical protein
MCFQIYLLINHVVVKLHIVKEGWMLNEASPEPPAPSSVPVVPLSIRPGGGGQSGGASTGGQQGGEESNFP